MFTSPSFLIFGLFWFLQQVKRSQNIVPVTIKQIIEAPEEGLNIAGVESNLVMVTVILVYLVINFTHVFYANYGLSRDVILC